MLDMVKHVFDVVVIAGVGVYALDAVRKMLGK